MLGSDMLERVGVGQSSTELVVVIEAISHVHSFILEVSSQEADEVAEIVMMFGWRGRTSTCVEFRGEAGGLQTAWLSGRFLVAEYDWPGGVYMLFTYLLLGYYSFLYAQSLFTRTHNIQ